MNRKSIISNATNLNNQEKKSFDFDKDSTDFINHPKKVEYVINNTPQKHMTTRPHKDDAELYTEDGILHSDDENIERGPFPKMDKTDVSTPNLDIPDEIDFATKFDDVD